MKTLLLATILARPIAAAPIFVTAPPAEATFTGFTITGAATPLGNGRYFADTINLAGTAHDRTVSITSPVPLAEVYLWLDNAPNLPGTGMWRHWNFDGEHGECARGLMTWK